MERFSLIQNTAIDYEDFIRLTEHFKTAAEMSFEQAVNVQIRAMKSMPFYARRPSDDITFSESDYKMHNDAATIAKGDYVGSIKPDDWAKACYVEMSVQPLIQEGEYKSAFANATFLGFKPEQATFYIQPAVEKFSRILINRNLEMHVGKGWNGNDRSYAEEIIIHRKLIDKIIGPEKMEAPAVDQITPTLLGRLGQALRGMTPV